jgi:hypothetical protein
MDLGAVVEVAIGLIFVWIVLSFATIQIQEWISIRLDKRAKDLEASLHEMLANPNLKSQFYDHPIIRGLTARKRKRPSTVPAWFYRYPIVRGFTREIRKLPSYIPSQSFALVIFDITMTAGTESSLIQQGILKIRDDYQRKLDDAKEMPKNKVVIDALNILADLARSAAATDAGTSITNYTREVLIREVNRLAERYSNFKDKDGNPDPELAQIGALLKRTLREASLIASSELEKVKQAAATKKGLSEGEKTPAANKKVQPVTNDAEMLLSKLTEGVAALSVVSPELNQTLSALFFNLEEFASEKEKQIAAARGNLENWFNSSMDRVSGVFKRYSQLVAVILGVVMALFLNVDSISLAQYLWREPAVRQILVTQASTYQPPEGQPVADPQQIVQQFAQQFGGLNLPVGWDIAVYGQRVELLKGMAIYNSDCQLFPHGNQYFGIPVFSSNVCITQPHSANATNILLKLFGILITAGATAQGAPFWFDVLKKFVNLRGTGPNPVEKGASK